MQAAKVRAFSELLLSFIRGVLENKPNAFCPALESCGCDRTSFYLVRLIGEFTFINGQGKSLGIASK
jgi:hypothetical protein